MNTNQISEEDFELYKDEVDEAEMPSGIFFINDDGNQIPVWVDPNHDNPTGDETEQFEAAVLEFKAAHPELEL